MTNPAVRVWADGRPGNIGLFTWLHKCVEEALPDVQEDYWQTAATSLDEVVMASEEVLMRHRKHGVDIAVCRLDGSLTHVVLVSGTVSCMTAGSERAAIQALDRLRDLVPRRALDEAVRRIPFTVWHFQQDAGGIHRSREIDVPSWKSIASNYSAPVRRALGNLMEGFEPGKGGQLILWHGPPGTGKTYAIRALAWEWRHWADIHYVTDPEILFGQQPGYMFEVILDAPTARAGRGEDDARWTILVLEDMGELLAPDARMQMGQGLSRVLNLVDGLLGQGLKLLIVVTTNEPLARVHPAVARPGRCAAQIEFSELDSVEVGAWFEARGESLPDGARGISATIASLHAMLDGHEPEAQRAVGFAS